MAFVDATSTFTDHDAHASIPDCVHERYLQVLLDLLPRGRAWDGARRPGSVFNLLMTGLALEYSRVEKRANELLEEMDPLFAVELISDWERALGLPRCSGIAEQSLAARQLAARDALVGLLSGPTKAYFEGLGVDLGYADIVIEVFGAELFKANSRCNDILYGPGWAFAWKVTATKVDDATDELLKCLFNFWKPLHTWIWWNLQDP